MILRMMLRHSRSLDTGRNRTLRGESVSSWIVPILHLDSPCIPVGMLYNFRRNRYDTPLLRSIVREPGEMVADDGRTLPE